MPWRVEQVVQTCVPGEFLFQFLYVLPFALGERSLPSHITEAATQLKLGHRYKESLMLVTACHY